ncbi:IclR family transcriptional regulator [Cupriavidus sp. 2MCAB6]|uniref:IclR family transcriptional regulator n=1 Tax=Cupriavidus sp. 2MCAB6 TaxID=3232981 RepID=UPI003F92D390
MAKSAFRALAIMEFVAQCKTGATHSEIAAGLGIPKSSLTGLLRDLQQPGYLHLDEGTARYSIGSQVMYLANAYLRNLNIVREGAPFVHKLYVELDEFSCLTLPKGNDCIVVCAESSPSPLAHTLNLGERLPMLANAAGRAILAFLDDTEIDEYLSTHQPIAYTARTLTKIKDIHKELTEVRKVGIAYGREEYMPGITALAAPVFNIQGRPIASIAVALPTVRLTKGLERKIESVLVTQATALSRRLGAESTKRPRVNPSNSGDE